jgi:hypothetical protein
VSLFTLFEYAFCVLWISGMAWTVAFWTFHWRQCIHKLRAQFRRLTQHARSRPKKFAAECIWILLCICVLLVF